MQEAQMAESSGWRPEFRIWLEDGDKRVIIDQTDAMLLRRVSETRSITEAAKAVGVSYRNAWARVKALEVKTGRRMVETKVGGRTGGGATLTPDGKTLLDEFRRMRRLMYSVLDDRESWSDVSYVLSARNRLPARVVSISEGDTTSEVRMMMEGGGSINSIVTNGAVQELGLRPGDAVDAIVKSTDVIVARAAVRDNRRLRGARTHSRKP